MTQKITILFVLATTLSVGAAAQQTLSTASGDATGTTGSVSYTLGQPFVRSAFAPSGASLSGGIQQPYTVAESVIEGIAPLDISTRVFPNPTADELVVEVMGEDNGRKLRYELYAVGGTLVAQGLVEGMLRLSMGSCPAGSYVLRLSDGDASRSYHIVKNK